MASQRQSRATDKWSSLVTLGCLLAPIVFIAAGAAASSSDAAGDMELIVVSPDGHGFVERDSGRAFIPFGTNYYDPDTGWAPKIWRRFDAAKVRGHFRVMKELGVNCTRVFLTAATFQPDSKTIDRQALEKLDTLIAIARQSGIRLMLTGPDHWEGVPPYWKPDRFAGEQALKALEHFWAVVAGRYRGEPAIFAWDLLNEPHLPWFDEQWRERWNKWLEDTYGNWDGLKSAWGEQITESDRWGAVGVAEDKPVTGSARLRDYQLFREHLADNWVRRQVDAIRRADPARLVTVGYIQWSYPLVRPGSPSRYAAFNPRRQARLLDFVTIHFYPTLGSPFESEANWRKNLDYLQGALAYCHTGKPVVLAEFGWYGGGAPQQHPFLSEAQQADWIAAEIEASRRLADGWLSWPFADTPESRDISLYAGLVKPNMSLKAWGRKFQAYASAITGLKKPSPELPVLDLADALTAETDELATMHQAYVEAIRRKMNKLR
ncbi:MAG: beta-galactosidase [Sedimentisphaerales bacterium]|nr:beta-galactosidase [Sedimentisphaerales bacterium]